MTDELALDAKISKLRLLLKQYPEMDNPDEFSEELEKRLNLYKEIRQEVEELGNDIDRIWAEKAWENVKNKKGE